MFHAYRQLFYRPGTAAFVLAGLLARLPLSMTGIGLITMLSLQRGAYTLAGAVAAYALSPIDLIPDFIPVLGYLDDLLIVPLGIALAVRLIPAALMVEFRAEAVALAKPINRPMAMAIVVLWIVACLTAAAWCWSKLR